PRRLVFTFGVPKFSAQVTRVSIDLKPLPGGCELTLIHEGVLPEWLERTREGWGRILDGLAAHLAKEGAA
ncbi:MAG: SRPBCC domain-containing protein, partial [Planctomycetota bacterium]